MRILITGAAGFIGQLLAKTLLNDEDGKYSVILTDIVEPKVPGGVKWPNKAEVVKADLLVDHQKLAEKQLDAAFLFHGIMSAGSEADFELGEAALPAGATIRSLLSRGCDVSADGLPTCQVCE